MKSTIRGKRTPTLDEDELRQLKDLSFSAVIADIARSEERSPTDPGRSQREIDLESTHTDRTINELLAGAFSETEPGSAPEASAASIEAPAPEASEATEDLIAPDILFPELTLKS